METEMGNRGSKSEIQHPSPNRISVKEQRVDGSWFLNINKNLRCTLMGFERSYQINNPSKQFKSYFSTLQSDINVQLNRVTGFTDAEGTFTVVFDKVNTRKFN